MAFVVGGYIKAADGLDPPTQPLRLCTKMVLQHVFYFRLHLLEIFISNLIFMFFKPFSHLNLRGRGEREFPFPSIPDNKSRLQTGQTFKLDFPRHLTGVEPRI